MPETDSSLNVPAGSALTRELYKVSATQRRALGVSDEVLEIWDAVISCVQLIVDDGDPRSWWDRLGTFLEARFGDIGSVTDEDFEKITAEFNNLTGKQVPAWASDIKKEGFQKFLRRAVGEARYQRLVAALQADAAVVTVALRRAARGMMPFAVALDDLCSTLPDNQRLKLPTKPGLPNSMLSVMLMLETSLEKLVDFSAPAIARDDLPAELSFATAEELLALVNDLREVVSGRSRRKVKELSATLDRKVQGARDALKYSADSVAQAANSLIELIDRLLRAAFTDSEVVSWVAANYPDSSGLTREDSGIVRPTKRGQILCFVHAGAAVDEPSIIHEMAASALNATRTQLQRLKHADLGTESEAEEIRRLLAAVEGFLHLAVGVAWATVPEQRIEQLKAKLDAPSVAP